MSSDEGMVGDEDGTTGNIGTVLSDLAYLAGSDSLY